MNVTANKHVNSDKDAWELLVYAIIVKACKDYECALCALRRPSIQQKIQNGERLDVLRVKNDCERFFKSQWFEALTMRMERMNGEAVMNHVRACVVAGKRAVLDDMVD